MVYFPLEKRFYSYQELESYLKLYAFESGHFIAVRSSLLWDTALQSDESLSIQKAKKIILSTIKLIINVNLDSQI